MTKTETFKDGKLNGQGKRGQKNKMNVLYVISKANGEKGEFYLIQLKMSLTSLVEHHEKGSLTINLIHENLTADEIEELKNLTKGHELNLILFPKERYEKELKAFNKLNVVGSHMSVFYRLFIQELLNKDVDKVLYLDLDNIINRNLSPFFRHKTKKGVMVALARHYARNLGAFSHVIAGRKIKQYFNAGVFLLNLKSLRERKFNLLQSSLMEAKRCKVLRLLDQHLLNLVFLNDKEIVSPFWIYYDGYPSPYLRTDKIHVFNTPINHKIDFSLMRKELRSLFNHYYKLVTGEEEYVPELSFKQKIKRNVLKVSPNIFVEIYIRLKSKMLEHRTLRKT